MSSDTFQNHKFSGETCENSLTRQFKILFRDDLFFSMSIIGNGDG